MPRKSVTTERTRLNVLLVEDDPQHAAILERALAAEYDLQIASTLAESRAALRITTPDVLLADYQLPDGLGTELLPGKNGDSAFPIIIMAAHDDQLLARNAIADGAAHYLSKSPEALLNTPGTIERTLHLWALAKERRQYFLNAKEQGARLQAVLDAAVGVAIIASDPDGIISVFNRGAELMLSMSASRMEGEKSLQSLHAPSDGMGVESIVDYINTLATTQQDWTWLDAHGVQVLVNIDAVTLPKTSLFAPSTGFLIVATDVTQRRADEQRRKQLEERVFQAGRMESLGQLAGGVAHDFNNLLSSMLGYAELALSGLQEQPDHVATASYIENILSTGERAKEVVRQMVAFSRTGTMPSGEANLEAAVISVSTLLRPTLPDNVQLVSNIRGPLPPISGDAEQLQRVLLNLCLNARDAVGRTGSILLSAGHQQVPRNTICISCGGEFSGDYISLSVADSGPGVDQQHLGRIFEPFFSLRTDSVHSGLGLSVVHGIVHAARGHIVAANEPGEGFQCCLFFPESRSHTHAPPVEHNVARTSASGRPHILVVDDEYAIARILKDALEDAGYAVTVAEDGTAALAVFSESPLRFDVVLTDQVMPGLSGTELCMAMLGLRPDLPVILCSGYAHGLDMESIEAYGVRKFIGKPFTLSHIIDSVEELLPSALARS